MVDRDETDQIARILAAGRPVDERGAELIFRHYAPALGRYARRQGAVDPEGVAQVALLKGLAVVPELRRRDESAFRAYVFRTARHEVWASNRTWGPDCDDITSPVVDWQTSTAFEGTSVDRIDLLGAIEALSPAQRETIEDRFLLGLSARESGAKRGRSPNAVDQLQHRALKRLRRLLFVVTALVVVFAGSWLWRQLGQQQRIDTAPIEQPDSSRSTRSTPVEQPDDADAVRSISAGAVEQPDEGRSADTARPQPEDAAGRAGSGDGATDGDQRPEPTAVDVPLDVAGASDPGPPVAMPNGPTRLVAASSGKCVSVWAGSVADLSRVVQWTCGDGAPSQMFALRPAGGVDEFFVVAEHSGKCLAVNGGATGDGAGIVQWPCSDGSYGNDVWRVEWVGERVRLRAKHSNRCMGVTGGSADDGVDLVQWTCASDNMLYDLGAELPSDPGPPVAMPNGPTRLVAASSGKCVSVWAGSVADLSRVVQWTCGDGAPSQMFALRPAGGVDEFFVVAEHSGKCLAVNGGATGDGAGIVQWPCSDGSYGNDVWRVEWVGERVRLRAKHSNRCMGVTGGSADDGVDLVQWTCAASDNMLYDLRP